ncbi:winged helix-turn-helix transcriptional regulator [Candidatus Bathyarchaeota archaeon]|nr:winged helix-turn-helix transcriptional regulator [Candidatus Bathyarchaeota archaeon]
MVELMDRIINDLSPGTSQFKVMVFLSFRGPSSPSVISDETGMPSGTVRPSLRNLLEKGYVKQLEDGNYKSNIPFTEFISYLYTTTK